MAVKDRLSQDHLSQESIEQAWKFADSLIIASATRSLKQEVQARNSKQRIQEKKKDGKCFIAAASLGADSVEEIIILSNFRDRVLAKNVLGRAFMVTYYKLSPPIARIVATSTTLRFLTRTLLVRPAARIVHRVHR